MRIASYQFYWLKTPNLKSVGRITMPSCQRLFSEQFQHCLLYLSDGGYDLFKDEDLWKVIKLNRFEEQPYITEKRDCDDFADVLKGHMKKLVPGVAFGCAWGWVLNYKGEQVYKHAINCFINQNQQLVFVEPQSNEEFKLRFLPTLVML